MSSIVRVEGEGRPFTVPNLAARWECSEGLIRKMIERGQLRSFRLGVLIRVPAEEVERIECQSQSESHIASNGSGASLPSSGTLTENGGGGNSTPKISRARKPRLGEFGPQATIHHGPWER